jgi:5-(carboxyamino)imidazole ribonucleotide mutase
MPKGVPVATVAIGAARNAGLLAARILATADEALARRLQADRAATHAEVVEKDERTRRRYAGDEGGFGFTG